ncbi:MAG: Endonuclease IV [Ktedonobacterales bacterium]|jgi:deoxyribonuclease-4|nr:MAG: Endonuclease IV [Ktedonobacterales bacterium]
MPTNAKPAQAMRIAREIGCDAAQIFVTNPRGWRAPDPNPAQEAAFRQAAEENGIAPIVVHATYLINLASPRDDFFANSVSLLHATLDRAERYGATSVVFHIGSHGGAGEEAGIARLADGLRRTLEGAPDSVMLLLENDVGGGGKLGYRFENLAAALDLVPEYADRLGVCLDTAHLWGAGFDIGTPEGATRTLDEADRILGLARVPVWHINDTPKALGSHLDNHARIGEGIIPLDGLGTLLRDFRLTDATLLLETPIAELANGKPDWPHDRAHMERARALAGLPMPTA